MRNSFSEIVAILFSVLIFFGLPYIYATEKIEMTERYYILSETAYFTDSLCSTGYLTEEMIDIYEKNVRTCSGIYEINYEIAGVKYALNEEENFERIYEYYDEEEFLNEIREAGYIYLYEGDLFKVSVVKNKGEFLSLFSPENEVVAYYGGMIREDGMMHESN